jgi:ribonuclease HI
MNAHRHDFEKSFVVYTDGACSGNPGPGGWAWAVAPSGEPCGIGASTLTTNQRMELTAAMEAVRTNAPLAHASGRQLVIVSDSTYVVNCFKDRWWERWMRNGWRNAKKEPVANVDLWREMIDLYLSFPEDQRPEFAWVKAHNGDPMNELVDQLAVKASLL